MTSPATKLLFTPMQTTYARNRVATLLLNRPEAANSFNGALLTELTQQIQTVAKDSSIRALIIKGAGKHFSAGADLNWMKESAQLDLTGNKQEAEKLRSLFEAIHQLSIPTIAVVNGAAFGGGVGLIAACDFAICVDDAKLCLSEAKIGLIPAVILPYLARKLKNGDLQRFALSARVFSAAEAKDAGLVQVVTTRNDLAATVQQEVTALLQAGPEAQQAFKKLQRELAGNWFAQSEQTVNAIATIRASQAGQAGLQSFLQQQTAPWTGQLTQELP